MQVKWDKIDENLGKKLKFQTTIDWQQLLEKDPRQFALYFHACLPFKISILGIKFPVAFRSCVTDAASSMSAFKYFMPKFKEVKNELHTTNPKNFIDHCFENVFSKLFQTDEIKQTKKMEAINDVGNRVLIHLITMDTIKNEPNVMKLPLVSIHNSHLLNTLKQTPLTKQEVIDTEKQILESVTLSIEEEYKLLKLYEFGKPHEKVIKEYSTFLQQIATSNNNNNNSNNNSNNNNNNNNNHDENKNSNEKKPRKSRKSKQDDTPKKKKITNSSSPRNMDPLNEDKGKNKEKEEGENQTTMDVNQKTDPSTGSNLQTQDKVDESVNVIVDQQGETQQGVSTETRPAKKTKKKNSSSEKKKTPKKQKIASSNSIIDITPEAISSETNQLPSNNDPFSNNETVANTPKENTTITPKKRGPNKKRNEVDELKLFQDTTNNNEVVKERRKNKQSPKQIDLSMNHSDQKQRILVSSVNNEELEAFKNLLFQTFCHVLHSEEKVAHVAISALIKTNYKLKDVLSKSIETDPINQPSTNQNIHIDQNIDQNIDDTSKNNTNMENKEINKNMNLNQNLDQNIHIDQNIDQKIDDTSKNNTNMENNEMIINVPVVSHNNMTEESK